jgi:hypothetical protein
MADRPGGPTEGVARASPVRPWVRLILRVYPPGYRRRWGDEIVTTLLESAGPRRRVRPGDVADVAVAGLRQRLAQLAPGALAGLAQAAPFALALAAGISAYLWWRVEPTVHTGGFLGSWRTPAPVAYAGWLIAAAVAVGWPPVGRVAVACALALTVAVPGLAILTTVERPPLWVLSVLLGLGLAALAGRRSLPTVDERLAVPAGAVAVVAVASAADRFWPTTGPAYYQPTIARMGLVLAVAAAVALVVAVRPARSGVARGDSSGRPWLWAATLLAVLAGWLGPVEVEYAAGGQRFGRLAEVLLASCVAALALRWLARPAGPGPLPMVGSLGGTGSLVLGCAGGLGGFLALGAAGRLGFVAPGYPGDYPIATVGLVALAGLLTVVAARRFRIRWAATGAALGVVVAWAVAAYDNDWTLRGWTDFGRTADLVATVALVPLFLCAVVAARWLIRPGRAPGVAARRGRSAGVGALVVSLVWLGLATVPYAASWAPPLAVLLACLGAVAVSRRGTAGPSAGGMSAPGRMSTIEMSTIEVDSAPEGRH